MSLLRRFFHRRLCRMGRRITLPFSTAGRRRVPHLEILEARELLAADLVISEFMATNNTALSDAEGHTPDWIEIHNAGTDVVDLAGWTLTDNANDLSKWQFPAQIIDPDEYLVVFASGKDQRPEREPLREDYHLLKDGTFAVNLPDGSYEVRVTLGDATAVRDEVAVSVQGRLLETVSSAAGEFVEVTGVAEVNRATKGQLEVRLQDLGGVTPRAAINALVITPIEGGTPLQFDFGSLDSPLASGYTTMTPLDVYDAGVEITVTADPFGRVSLDGGATFTPSASFYRVHTTPQTVTVRAFNDHVAQGPHAATFSHAITSTGVLDYPTSLPIASLVADVADDDVPGVTIIESDGRTDIGEAGTTDVYTIALNDKPSVGTVEVSVTADAQSEVSLDGGATFHSNVSFSRVDTTPQTITVRAVDDSISEGPHTSTITHAITTSNDPDYRTTLALPSVVANVTDNDAAGVTITETGFRTDLHEGNATDTYTIALDRAPSGTVEIGITADAQSEVSLDGGVTFATGVVLPLVDTTPQTVTVRAVDDMVKEGSHTSTITHAITSSADPDYPLDLPIAAVVANIADNDVAGVTVIESGSSTKISEAGGTDTYTIALDTVPDVPTDYGWLPGTDVVAVDRKLHTNFQLNADGDYVALVSPAGVVVSSFGTPDTPFPPQYADVSYGLVPAADPLDPPKMGYMMTPTPGAANSGQFAVTGPALRNVTENPGALDDDEDLVVTATVEATYAPIASVELTYRVMFGDEVTVPMVDDGTGGDRTAGDGVYAAAIPHLAANPGEMVRWYVTALDTSGHGARGPLTPDVHFSPGLFTFDQDFSAGTADGFASELGTWTVTDGRYEAAPDAAGDVVTLIPALADLPDDFEVVGMLNIPSNASGKHNAAILFDYRGPMDFKFAIIDADGGQVAMGTRTAAGWIVDDQHILVVDTDTDLDLRVAIHGSAAELWWGGLVRLRHDFQTPLNNGLVGFGSNGSALQIVRAQVKPDIGITLESPEYYGTIIADPNIDSQLPVLHWFLEADPRVAATRTGTAASMFFLDEFYDNIHVDLHGQSTSGSSFPKKSYDVSFNPGRKFKYAEDQGRVSDFNLLTNYADKTKIRNTLAYETYRNAGHQYHVAMPIRVQRNGRFYALYDWLDEAGTEYLERQGLDPNGAMYKVNNPLTSSVTDVEKRTRKYEDRSDLQTLVDSKNLPVTERNAWWFDNLDIASWVNFLATMVVTGNIDCCHKNYYVYRDSDGTGQWQIFPWDLDLSFGHNYNATEKYFDDDLVFNTGPFQGNTVIRPLYDAPGFREMYVRRLRTLMDELLQPPGTPENELKYEARIDQLITQIGDDAELDQAAWGFPRPFAPQSARQAAADLKSYYLPHRREFLYETYNQGRAPRDQIPAAQVGDPEILIGAFEARPTSGNLDEQYVRLDNPHAFAVDISGRRLAGDIRMTFEPGTVIPAGGSLYAVANVRAFLGRDEGPGGGQGLFVQGEFTGRLAGTGTHVTLEPFDPNPSPTQAHLRITELNYNPYEPLTQFGDRDVDNDRFEFVELANTGTQPLDLAGVSFTDGFDFTFGDVVLAGGARTVVVRDRAAFLSRYGTGPAIAGQFASGKLSNRGETIRLEDADGRLIVQFTYGDGGPWPGRADGHGATLEVIDPEGDDNDPANWHSSRAFGGTPGTGAADPVTDVLINEVLARGVAGVQDQIELVNTTGTPIDVGGWYLSDNANDPLRWAIPAGTTIPARGYVAFDQDDFGFGISGTLGDQLWLFAAAAGGRPVRLADRVAFDATDPGVALGRWPDADPEGILLPMVSPSFGAANSGPVTGAAVLSELYYNPPPLPGFFQDFAQGTAAGFVPIAGSWQVSDGRYVVAPVGDSEPQTLMAEPAALTSNVRISATVNIPTETEFKRNAVLMFDYHGPTDFKFAALFAKSGKYKMGQRDADGWHFTETVVEPIPDGANTRITVNLQGTEATLWVNDVLKIRHDYGTQLNGGQIGLGTRDGTARFDDVRVEQRGDEQQFEFVELTNTTSAAVDLGGWRLRGGVDMTFAAGTTLGAGETRVVVGFDPVEGNKAATFRNNLGMADSTELLGPYLRQLSNTGEALQLVKPVGVGTDAVILVDQVGYDDRSPWPTAADGQGRSLNRVAVTAFGNRASSWAALAPTPGTVPVALVGDLDFDGAIDVDDVRQFAAVLAAPAVWQATYGVPAVGVADVDGNGRVDFDDIDHFVALVNGGTPGTGVRAAVGTAPFGAVVPDVRRSGARLASRRASVGARAPRVAADRPVPDAGEHRHKRRRDRRRPDHVPAPPNANQVHQDPRPDDPQAQLNEPAPKKR